MKLTLAIAATVFVNGLAAELEASSAECEATPGVPTRECLRQPAASSSPLLLQFENHNHATLLTGAVGQKGVRGGMRSNAKERRGDFSRDESDRRRRRSCGSTTCEAEQGRWPFVAKIFTFGAPGICMDFSTYQLKNQTSLKTGGDGVFSGMRVIAFDPAGAHDMVVSSVSAGYTNYHYRAPVLNIRASSMVRDDDGPFPFRGSLEYFWPDGTDLARFPAGLADACGTADTGTCHRGLYNIDYANSTLDTSESLVVPPDLREDIARASIYRSMAWGTFAKDGPLTSADPGFNYRLVGRSVLDYKCQCSGRCSDVVLLYQHPEDLSCVLVFGGSDELCDFNDWLYNAAVGRTFWCGLRDLHWGLVNEFRDNLQSNAFQENIKTKLPSCSFVHTAGHSKGGAQAQMFAACASRYASCDNTEWWNRRRRHCNTDHSLVTWDWVAPEAMEEVEI